MSDGAEGLVRAVVTDHIAAVNVHDRVRLLAGLAPDVLWSTGVDTFYGTRALEAVFDDGLWVMQPSLAIVEVLVEGNLAAAQMVEVLTVGGEVRRFSIACFFEVHDGRVQRVKVYQEGSADID